MVDEPVSLATWKKSPVIAGAMMLIKGYAPPVLICDACRQPLEREDRTIHVTFSGHEARYPCPHCHGVSVRTLRQREPGDVTR